MKIKGKETIREEVSMFKKIEGERSSKNMERNKEVDEG